MTEQAQDRINRVEQRKAFQDENEKAKGSDGITLCFF